MGESHQIELYPILGGPEDIPICSYINLRCVLARGDQRNCKPGISCKKRLIDAGYEFAGDTWQCRSCKAPYGGEHSQSCGIGGPGAQ